MSDTEERKCDTSKDSFTYYTAFIFFRKMLLKVADVAHEEWNSLLECLEKSQGKSIQVSVEKSFGQMKYLVQFFFGGGKCCWSIKWVGGRVVDR